MEPKNNKSDSIRKNIKKNLDNIGAKTTAPSQIPFNETLNSFHSDVKLTNPLSEITRKERKFLLLFNVIGLLIIYAGIIPTKINALGITFESNDKKAIIRVFSFIIIYFLTAFVIYAWSDFISWRLALLRDLQDDFEKNYEKSVDIDSEILFNQYKNKWRILSSPTSKIRALFEFIFPIVISIFTVITLLTTNKLSL